MAASKCANCGEEIKDKRNSKDRKYCSIECFHQKSPSIEIVCQVCGKSRLVKPADIADGKGKYCSHECYHKATRNRVELVCCNCGKSFETFPCYLRKGTVRYCSRKCYFEFRSKNLSGARKVRNSKEYKEWRDAVYARDNYTCQECGKQDCELHAHHIFTFADFPDLRFEVWNGVTLCVGCHQKEHPDIEVMACRI